MTRKLCLLILAPVVSAAAMPGASVEIHLEKLRNSRGVVHLCLTGNAATFPDCARDPQAITRTVPAASLSDIRIDAVRPGAYALAIFHDENGNTLLDSFFGIPREGFGFSRNPAVRFGPPRFDQARFDVASGI